MQLPLALVEDCDGTRRSLHFQIESAGYKVVAFPSALSFLDVPVKYSCLITDVRMPGMNGIELLAILRERHPSLPVIMISGHSDVPVACRAMKMGASDFLSKPFSGDELFEAVRFALGTDATVSEPSKLAISVEELVRLLTDREMEVAVKVSAGMSSREIAKDLGVSFKTVEAHRSKIMAKSRAPNTVTLVAALLGSDDWPFNQ